MSIYVYALINSGSTLFLPQGMFGKLEVVRLENVAAIIETNLPLQELRQNNDKLLKAVLNHDRIIQAIFAQTTVLPLRFGIAFNSKENLVNYLQENRSEHLNKLDAFKERSECNLTFRSLPFIEEKNHAETKGKAYLLSKKQQYQKQEQWSKIQQEQWQKVSNLIKEIYPDLIDSNSCQETKQIYLLTQNKDTELESKHLPYWQKICSHWQINLSSSLPPYHFC